MEVSRKNHLRVIKDFNFICGVVPKKGLSKNIVSRHVSLDILLRRSDEGYDVEEETGAFVLIPVKGLKRVRIRNNLLIGGCLEEDRAL